jgi:CRP/FNR family transcriptional regulator
MDAVYRFLRKIYSDKNLVDEIMAKSRFVVIPAHTKILEEEKYVKVVPLVYEGRIRVMRKVESGKEILLYYIDPGESCALSIAAGLNETKSVAYAETETETKMFAIPIDLIRNLHTRYPQFEDFLLRLFHNRFNELILFIDSIAFKTMDFRLIRHLKREQEKTGKNVIHTTHQHLADELGTAREVISRLLKQLENDGKIVNHRSKIEILDQL